MWCIFRIVRNSQAFTVSGLQLQNCQIFYTTIIRNGTAEDLALDTRRENVRQIKTQQLTQESSLITGGFSWASDVERSELLLWNDISQWWWYPDLLQKKKCQRKCKENIQVSVFLPCSPRGLISDHTENGESLPHNGEQLLILCQNIFKIWTVPSFLWCAALSVGLVTGGVMACSSNTQASLHFSVWHVKCDGTKRFHFNCLDRSLKGERFWFWVLTE